jgi:hypothetical protein
MSRTRLLRLAIWASVVSAVLCQTAFLFELHSPLPSDFTLWFLSILSVACVVVILLARGSLTAKAKISYRPEGVCLQRNFDVGAQYRVQGDYCVILCRRPSVPLHSPRIKCFYLSEGSADRAVTTASIENPQWRAVGVEPPNPSFAHKQQSGRSHSTFHTWDVA